MDVLSRDMIGDVAMSMRKHKIFGQMWVLFHSLRVQNEGYIEHFRRGTENTEIFVFEVTGGEFKSYQCNQQLPTVSQTAVSSKL